MRVGMCWRSSRSIIMQVPWMGEEFPLHSCPCWKPVVIGIARRLDEGSNVGLVQGLLNWL